MEPSTADRSNSYSLSRKVWKTETLYKAWLKVKSNGRQSGSLEIRREIDQFESNVLRNIRSLSSRLSRQSFEFAPGHGVKMVKKGKKPRPIVIAPVENRIVQRAILDVLQSVAAVKEFVNSVHSYGGIKDDNRRSVATAISALIEAKHDGCKWFAKSDIKSFFVGIPRASVVEKIGRIVDDREFVDLFRRAMDVELDNMAELGKDANMFPIYEIGVAQGCCLSPFVGNALLHDFDSELNQRGIQCLRYIDDFLILGRTRGAIEKAFRKAQEILSELRLEIHDPTADKSKTSIGRIAEGVEFLGVEALGDIIRPTKDARDRMLKKLDKAIGESMASFANPKACYRRHRSLSHTLTLIDNTIDGWVGQYKFCNDTGVVSRMNRQIDSRIRKYLGRYSSLIQGLGDDFEIKRNLLGVRYLSAADFASTDDPSDAP